MFNPAGYLHAVDCTTLPAGLSTADPDSPWNQALPVQVWPHTAVCSHATIAGVLENFQHPATERRPQRHVPPDFTSRMENAIVGVITGISPIRFFANEHALHLHPIMFEMFVGAWCDR